MELLKRKQGTVVKLPGVVLVVLAVRFFSGRVAPDDEDKSYYE